MSRNVILHKTHRKDRKCSVLLPSRLSLIYKTYLFFSIVLEIKLRTLYISGKCCTPQQIPNPSCCWWFVWFLRQGLICSQAGLEFMLSNLILPDTALQVCIIRSNFLIFLLTDDNIFIRYIIIYVVCF